MQLRFIPTPRRAFFLVFFLAVSLRAILVPLLPLDPSWQLRQENGATAETLVRTGEYANPYALPTGFTAHPVPFYTAVIALSYRFFGVTRAAELARCWLAAISFSALYALLPWIAARLGVGAPAGFIGGLAGALSPLHLAMGIFYGGLGEEFAGLAMALILVASLSRWTSQTRSVRGSVLIGLAWGAAFHISPPLLLVMLSCLGFELWWNRARPRLLHPCIILLGAALACVPWALRNYNVFGEFIFIRSNFGLELRMGNHEGATAAMETMDRRELGSHPRIHRAEAEKVRALGEVEYMRRAKQEALQWIGQQPLTFLRLTVSRIGHFWFGPPHAPMAVVGTGLLTILAFLGARRVFPLLSVPQRAALLLPLATFPVIYYLVAYMPRYRVPIDWILLMLAGTEVVHWFRRGMAPNRAVDGE